MAAVRNAGRPGTSGKVVRTMWLFSWVQLAGIVCSVVRTKLVALWIGTVGIGLFGLFNTALDSITTLTQLGIRQSPVRNIAAAADDSRLSRIVAAVRCWSWILGIAGAFLTLVFSPLLSELTFGTPDHTVGFIILSAAVMMSAVTNGELAIMQGLDRLNRLARATVWGTLGGLAVSVPLYYFFREASIVWSILAYFLCQAVAVYACRERRDDKEQRIAAERLTRRQLVAEGREFVTLGIYMTVSVFIAMVVNYLFMAYLNSEAGLDEVGEYQAGYTIVNKYLGLIFTAIGFEFFPRISKVQASVSRVSTFVSHEIMVALVVILPGATIMMTLDDVIVKMLYSSDFMPAVGYVNYALAGTALRAISWCMAYTILARGDGRIYLVTETMSGLAFLVFSYFGYRFGGLEGLGVAYSAWYGLYTVIVGVVYFGVYRMRLNRRVVLLSVAVIGLTVGCAVARTYGLRVLPAAVAAVSSVAALRVIRSMLAARRK
ncbi:MAG: O-antigen translocase [Bacteroidales bacterium]|nr:O-antigen translocase [Bacteroidales bacterium]MBD5248425.1 O-antigen translocase [Barnesiella sp.]